MKPWYLVLCAALAACSSSPSNLSEESVVDWPPAAATGPTGPTGPETFHQPGPVDLSGEFDLARVIEIAAQRNPRLEAARRRWLAWAQRPAQARALPDPLLRYTEMVAPTETRIGPLERQLQLTQPLPYPGKLAAAGAVAEEEARIRELKYHIALRDTVADVKVTYAEFAFLRKALRIVEQNRDLARQLTEKTAALYGKREEESPDAVTLFDTLKAQAQLAQLAYDTITLEELRQVETANLNGLLSRAPLAPLGAPRDLAFRPLDASLEELYGLGLQYRQELAVAVRAIAAADEAQRLAELARVPDFTVGVTYGQIGSAVSPLPDSGDDSIGLNFGLSLPVWVTKNRARAEEARQRRLAAERDRQAEIDDLMARLSKVYFRMQNAERLVRLYEESLVPQAEEALEIAEQWRDVGRDTIGRYLEAQSVWLNFQLAYHRALADHEQMVARLEQLVGTSLGHLRERREIDEDG